MDIILNGLRIANVQYGYGGAAAGAGIAGFFFFFMIIMFIISIGIGIFFIFGIYKIIIKAGYSNDKAILYTLLFTFIPIVNLILFYFFAFKEEWPILQEIRALRGGKPYSRPLPASGGGATPAPVSNQDIPPKSPVSSTSQPSGTIKCHNCGAEVKEGTFFCGKCGSGIGASKQKEQNKTCANCGTENASDAKFCENCGKSL